MPGSLRAVIDLCTGSTSRAHRHRPRILRDCGLHCARSSSSRRRPSLAVSRAKRPGTPGAKRTARKTSARAAARTGSPRVHRAGPRGCARAIEAINEERAAGIDIAPNDYLRTFVTRGKAALERKTALGADAELDAKGERQLKHQEELTAGTMVRRLDLGE